jgi:ATP-dependent helicase YprA (DUF1998 family)
VIESLDAVAVSDRIRDTYLRYLRTLLPLRDTQLRSALHRALADRATLVKGPLLEATPPYASGASLRALIDDGTLSSWFERLQHASGVPLDRPLYQHQEEAIRRAVTGRNLVVATGTGSGKTESFLFPILDHLAREREAGTLAQPGVRALLLYPMNALANDQLKRLRDLLRETPEITFGRYTGETENDPGRARERFQRQHPGVAPQPNEILSRAEMQAAPPHLLLTNYAMLEYLLLRPRDTSLFDGATGDHWRFLVLDEAHVYDGAAGIEVAMLLRRVRDRVSPERPLQAIATSATVGGKGNGPAVAEFASELFGLPFEYEAHDPSRQDVVWATRRELSSDVASLWGPLAPSRYRELLAASDVERASILEDEAGRAGKVADLLTTERRISQLREILAAGPQPMPEVAEQLFPDESDAIASTAALVSLGAGVHDELGSPLLPARYHLWARATEGAFSCLSPDGPHVKLTRHEVCEHCRSAVVEIGSCKRCSATYLIGTKTRPGRYEQLTPPRRVGTPLTWLVLLDVEEEIDASGPTIDEDDATLEALEEVDQHLRRSFCTACGALGEADGPPCACAAPWRRVLEVDRSVSSLRSCGLCGGRSNAGQIRRLESGADASVAVLSTALYQALPPDPAPELAEKPGGGRKLLFFADSRQEAAYFAPYLEDSYANLVRRRVVYEAIVGVDDPDDAPRLDDVAERAIKVGQRYGLFDWRTSRGEKLTRASEWVHAELLTLGMATSLEGLGLVAFDLMRPPGLDIPPPLLDLGLDDESGWTLVRELLRTVRSQGAVTFPDTVAADAQVFEPRIGPIFLRGEGPDAKRKVLSWLPGRGVNARIDYLRRVTEAIGATGDPTQLARGLWRWLTVTGPARELLVQTSDLRSGIVEQLDHRLITVRLVDEDRPAYRCSRCRRLAPVSVHAVCPTLRCKGRLTPWSPSDVSQDDNHYRAIARSLFAVPLRISEHTAQFRSEEAAAIQQAFLDGDLNALSCSTTFELGVDVGELQSVLLRNVPPKTSNYVQRAGRAGRRTDAAALVVTYAQRRSHDLTHFMSPERMIAGVVRAPRVTVTNDRIGRRHAHAIALAAYFREAADHRAREVSKTADLFNGEEDEHLIRWLRDVPATVTAAVRRALPQEVHDRVGLDDGSWIERLVSLLSDLSAQHLADVETYRQLEKEAGNAANYGLAQVYSRVVNTFENRQLIAHLSSHNVLPKYGFPVDTVELRTSHLKTAEAAKIELTRDLRLAISDYAPGSELVANGYLWKSGGVYRFPDRELPTRHYVACSCGWYEEGISQIELEACPACGNSGKKAPRSRTYIEPEFGFVASRETPKRPSVRPQRVYANTVHLVDASLEADARQLVLETGAVVEHRYAERGQLVVINDGRGLGYRICKWCGAGEQAAPGQRSRSDHEHPLSGRTCRGPWDWVSLGHTFETDVLELRIDAFGAPAGADAWWGLLYAVVEAAAERLEIARDDIDGTLHLRRDGPPTLILFDDVPAGAGHVRRVREELETVLHDAYRRVATCECGPETSCYRCLRGFRNQRMHDQLRRGAVAELLGSFLGVRRPAGSAQEWEAAVVSDFEIYDGRLVRVSTADGVLEGYLWVEAVDGVVTSLLLQGWGDQETVELDPDVAEVTEVVPV